MTSLITGYGASLTIKNFAVLGMPLVKTVIRAGPKGKSLTWPAKLVCDQPPNPRADENSGAATRLRNYMIG